MLIKSAVILFAIVHYCTVTYIALALAIDYKLLLMMGPLLQSLLVTYAVTFLLLFGVLYFRWLKTEDIVEKALLGRIISMSFFVSGGAGIIACHLSATKFNMHNRLKFLFDVVGFYNYCFLPVQVLLGVLFMKDVHRAYDLFIVFLIIRCYTGFFDVLMLINIIKNREIVYLRFSDYLTGFGTYYSQIYRKKMFQFDN